MEIGHGILTSYGSDSDLALWLGVVYNGSSFVVFFVGFEIRSSIFAHVVEILKYEG